MMMGWVVLLYRYVCSVWLSYGPKPGFPETHTQSRWGSGSGPFPNENEVTGLHGYRASFPRRLCYSMPRLNKWIRIVQLNTV